MANKKLKIGLLLDSYMVPMWAYEMINIISSSDYAEVTATIVNVTAKPKPNKTLFEKVKNSRGRFGYLFIRKILEVLYDKLVDRADILSNCNETRDCRELLSEQSHSIHVVPKMNKHSDVFSASDIDKIEEFKFDVLIRLGFRILRGDILTSAKYGVWSFHHGDNQYFRGGPAGFWESFQNWPETGSILQILSDDLDNGKVLYRSFSATEKFSVKGNVNNYFWKSLHFLPRKLKELHSLGEEVFFRKVDAENEHPNFYSRRMFTSPTNKELAVLTCKKLIQKAKLLLHNRKYFNQWVLMFDLRDDISSSMWRYKAILPPKDRFWADPHVIYRNEKYYIFIEEYLHNPGKGHIAVMEMDKQGHWSEPQKVLEQPYHLSYPFVFEQDGVTYMIPESVENRSVELYQCSHFPDDWIMIKTLMSDIELLDATLLQHNGKWWMFANGVTQHGCSSWDELFVYYANDFKSDNWVPHPQNPVVSDCKNSRPAGAIFKRGENLYRPSQNSSHHYGYGFNINLIEVLNELEYKEKKVSKILPNWDKNVESTHTFNHVNTLSIIDAQVKRRKR